jgi:hypothetical protein
MSNQGEINMTTVNQIDSVGIATSSMLVELNISCWTARKLDKKVSEEIDTAKNTNVKAGNYHKHLLAGNPHLDAVVKYAANVRLWNTKQTIPWSDAGGRIVTMDNLFTGGYKSQLDNHKIEFDRLAANFINIYPTLISASAFQLGDLFDRNEYPEAEEIVKKFKFNYTLSPLATSGDFRIDIGEQARNEIIQHYEEQFQERLNSAMRDVWDRLHDCLKHMSERLTSEEDGTRKKFHGTLLTNARELVDLLSRLNVTQDPQLEQARRDLSAALLNTDIDALKDSDYVRENVKQKVDAIINKFNW